jgi:pimeloyl-ACP methyl ester carboxylesterase
VNPFFFGTSEEPLFGVYHPPHSDTGRAAGIVLCYPLGQEYMRAHRAFRQLALLLSRAGFHVMRFDYFGTGDSAGDGTEATIERWIADIGTAIDELKDTADVDEVAVVGLRLGATLAAKAVAARDDVPHFILWDPVVHGKAYFEQELVGQVRSAHGVSAPVGATMKRETIGVNGFPLTPALQTSLVNLELKSVPVQSSTERFVVVSSETPEQKELAASLRSGSKDTFVCVPSDGNWNEVDDFGSALIPQAIIRAIVNHLSDRAG